MNLKNLFLLIALLVLVGLNECYQVTSPAPDIPEWLSEQIQQMRGEPYYMGTVIYRHTWSGEYYYHFNIPVSSCAYCDVYDSNGFRIEWTDDLLTEYLKHRTDESIVWHRYCNDTLPVSEGLINV